MTQRRSSGFALGLLVAALAMASVAALSLLAIRFDEQQQRAWVKQTSTLLATQASTIERAILRCGELYPAGLNNDSSSPSATKRFPASSEVLASARCPGASGQDAKIFSGRDGAFVAPLPGVDFGSWSFHNETLGLYASVETKSQRASDAARAAAAQSRGTLAFDGRTIRVALNPPAAPGAGTPGGSTDVPAVTPPPSIPTGPAVCGPEPKQPKPPADPAKYAQFEQDWIKWQNEWTAWQWCLVANPAR